MKNCCFCLVTVLIIIGKEATTAQNISKNTHAPLDPKVTGGKPVSFEGNWHVASLRYIPGDIPFGNGHFCAGSLISLHKIVTAAHCFFDFSEETDGPKRIFAEDIRIVMGTLDRFQITDNTIIISNNITYAYHSGYRPSRDYHDIGVIFLNKTIPADHPVVKPITLNRFYQPTGTPCKTSGWGATSTAEDLESMPSLLHGIEINILDYKKCKQLFFYYWDEGMMCAGDWAGGKDACLGDSGGGLVCNDLLVGIVSWGVECGRPRLPGIYTNVAYYLNWIQNCKSADICNSGVVFQKQHVHSYAVMFLLILTAFLMSNHRYCE